MWVSRSGSGASSMSPEEQTAALRRMTVPENEVPVVVPFGAVLARTSEAAVSVMNVRVYSTGLEFTVDARLRQTTGNGDLLGRMGALGRGIVEAGDVLSDTVLRIAVLFADGRMATNLSDRSPWGDDGPLPTEQPVLAHGSGSGSPRHADASFWLTPLPPPGPVTFVCEWPVHGIGESRAELDAAVVLDAVAHVVTLWPQEPEPSPGAAPRPRVPGTGLFATGEPGDPD